MTKTCPICKAVLEATTGFYRKGSRIHRDGSPYYQYGCKACRLEMTKEWQSKHPERTREISKAAVRKYHQTHREEIRTRRKEARQANPEHYRALWRARYARLKGVAA